MYQNNVSWLDKFCARHPKFGIPNLMLYIAVGNVAIYLIDLFSMGGLSLASILSFSRSARRRVVRMRASSSGTPKGFTT